MKEREKEWGRAPIFQLVSGYFRNGTRRRPSAEEKNSGKYCSSPGKMGRSPDGFRDKGDLGLISECALQFGTVEKLGNDEIPYLCDRL